MARADASGLAHGVLDPLTDGGDERMRIEATAHGLSGRVLQIEMPGRSLSPLVPFAGLDAFRREGEFSRERLAADALRWSGRARFSGALAGTRRRKF